MSRRKIPEKRDPAEAFWSYARALYAASGVAPACLALQEEAGADVNLLLLACWLAERGWPPLPGPLIGRLEALVADWRAEVIEPLRRVRRRLKGHPAELYEAAKACELAAERAETAALAAAAAALEADGTVVPQPAEPAEKRRAAALSLAVYLERLGAEGNGQKARVEPILNAAFPSSA